MPMIAKGLLAVAVTAVAVALLAPPAGAHANFVGVAGGVPADTDQALVVHVPHEREANVYNVDVVVAMAEGWRPLACEPKPTWTCTLGSADGRQTVQFSKAAGSAPAEDEDFAFTVHSPPVEGAFAFPTVQTYSTGEVVRWISAEAADTPAPRLTTTPAPATTATTTATTAATTPTTSSAGPGTSTVTIPAASSATATTTSATAAATTGQAAPTSAADDVDDGDDGGSGSGWLWLVLIALGVAAVAVGVERHRRSRGRPSADG